jgi:CPA1 family monovalent cation:H+ antiporter
VHRDLFLVITDIIVVFSIIVQGLTEEPLVKKLEKNSPDLLS